MKTLSQTEFQRNYKKYENDVKRTSFIIYKNNKPEFVTIPYEQYLESSLEDEKIIKKAINRFVELSAGKRETIKGEDVWKELEKI